MGKKVIRTDVVMGKVIALAYNMNISCYSFSEMRKRKWILIFTPKAKLIKL
jgi:hypothetical protein